MAKVTDKTITTIVNVCYSLPRVFTTQIQCSFGTYFWEMYTQEFGWTAAEYGKVQSLFNITQFFSYIVLGIVYLIMDLLLQDDNQVEKKLCCTKGIEVLSILVHADTSPYQKLPGKVVFKTLSDYPLTTINVGKFPDATAVDTLNALWAKEDNVVEQVLESEPKSLSTSVSGCNIPLSHFFKSFRVFMKTHKGIVYTLVITHGIATSMFELSHKAIPVIIYPKKILIAGDQVDGTKTVKVLSGDNANAILADLLKLMFLDVPAKDVETKGVNVATKKPTQTVKVNGGKVINTFGSDVGGAAPTNNYPLSAAVDYNSPHRGNMITINFLFFTVANLLVIWLFSFVRYYWQSQTRLVQTFFIISFIYLVCQLPLSIGFFKGTVEVKLGKGGTVNRKSTDLRGDTNVASAIGVKFGDGKQQVTYTPTAPGKTIDDATLTKDEVTFGQFSNNNTVSAQVDPDDNPDHIQLLLVMCLTIFHSTVFFWIFTGGPLTFYVSTHILGGHDGIRAFGVATILIGFTGPMVIPGILSLTGNAGPLFSPAAKQGIMVMCICTQIFTFMFLYPHDYWWNPRRWFNFVILVITGASNTFFLNYTNIIMDDVVQTQKIKCLFNGLFYAIMSYVVSKAMGIMFNAFGKEGTTGFHFSSIQVVIEHDFPSVYKSITMVFMLANIIALLPILAFLNS